MEFNLTTFFLEIINFLVLIWLLKRFFYQPVLNAVEKRRASIEATLTEASQKDESAKQLQEQYNNRLNDWEAEKSQKWAEFQNQMEQEREKRLAMLEKEIAQNRQKAEFLFQQEKESVIKQAEELAQKNTQVFTHQLLIDFSGPELTSRMLHRALHDLKNLSETNLKQLQHNTTGAENIIKVASAHELNATDREDLENLFTSLFTGTNYQYQYKINKDLIAGIKIQLGPWLLRANLMDELEAFLESAYESA